MVRQGLPEPAFTEVKRLWSLCKTQLWAVDSETVIGRQWAYLFGLSEGLTKFNHTMCRMPDFQTGSESHPVWGVRIEMVETLFFAILQMSHPVWGVRIEILLALTKLAARATSHPV